MLSEIPQARCFCNIQNPSLLLSLPKSWSGTVTRVSNLTRGAKLTFEGICDLILGEMCTDEVLDNPLTVFLILRKEEGSSTEGVGVVEDQSRGREVYQITGRTSPVGTAKKRVTSRINVRSLLHTKKRMR